MKSKYPLRGKALQKEICLLLTRAKQGDRSAEQILAYNCAHYLGYERQVRQIIEGSLAKLSARYARVDPSQINANGGFPIQK